MLKSSTEKFIIYFLIVVICAIAIRIHFSPFMPKVFYGDDLSNILAFKRGEFSSSLVQSISSVYSEKFRPIFSLAMFLAFSTFGESIEYYHILNTVVHVAVCLMMFITIRKLSGGNKIVAVALMLPVAISRFALYQVTQVTGLLEGMGTLFFVLMILSLVNATGRDTWFYSILSLISGILALYTHERYVVILPWFVIAVFTLRATSALSLNRKFSLTAISIAAVVINVLVKKLAGGHVLVGTGGTQLEFNPLLFSDNFSQALLSIFGFNYGPDYLIGLNWFDFPNYSGLVIGLVITTVTGALLFVAATSCMRARTSDKSVERSMPDCRWGALILLLAGVMLIPPALTIRMEPRWEFQPFLLLLLLVAWSVGSLYSYAKKAATVAAVSLLSGALLALDLIMSSFFYRIYMQSSARVAELVFEEIIQGKPPATSPLAFLLPEESCSWTLLEGSFFEFYSGKQRSISCLRNLVDTKVSSDTEVYTDTGSEMMAVPTSLLNTDNEKQDASFDFLQSFDLGVISNLTPVDTPSGRGVVHMSWHTLWGTLDSLVVVSGFSYRFDNVHLDRNTILKFCVAMLYPARQAAISSVNVLDDNGNQIKEFRMRLIPPEAGKKISCQPVEIPIEQPKSRKVSFVFAAEPTGDDTAAQWLGYFRPRLIESAQ